MPVRARRRRAAAPSASKAQAAATATPKPAPPGREIVLYCEETPGLKLGPSDQQNTLLHIPGKLLVFDRGFARFDEAKFPEWRNWVNHPGTPRIEVLESATEQVPVDDPNAHACPIDGKAFSTAAALRGHLLSHAKAAVPA